MSSAPSPRLRAATAYEELAYFALSSVGVTASATGETRAAVLVRVEDPALATTARTFDEDEVALTSLAGDGILVAQGLPRLFAFEGDLPALMRRAGRASFADLGSFAETNARVHSAMTRGDTRLAELLLCEMALASEAFVASGFPFLSATTRAAIGEVDAALRELSAIVPAVLEPSIVVCAALGISGRVFRDEGGLTIHAGVTRHEEARDGREAALLVLHEVAVAAANAPYARAERAAIDAVSLCVRDTSFADAYARRLARFSLKNLAPSREADPLTDVVHRALVGAPA